MISYATSVRRISQAEKSIARKYRTITSLLSNDIERCQLESKWPFENLKELSRDSEFIFWWIVEQDGVIKMADNVSFIGSRTCDYFPQKPNLSPGDELFLNKRQNYGICIQALEKGAKTWTFWLGFSTKRILRETKAIIVSAVMYSVLALVVLAIVLWFVIIHFLRPVRYLAEGAGKIGTGDLEHRVKVISRDELGYLAHCFNKMAEDLSNTTTSIDNLNREIAERKRREEELKEVHKQLLSASHRAGMAEVATDVLHNVGNVLNSINVTASFIRNKLSNERAGDLRKVADIVEEHSDDLGTFFTEDRRGRHIPRYLSEAGRLIANEQEAIAEKLRSLGRNIEHINEIVRAQQAYAGAGGVEILANIRDIIEDAVQINGAGLRRHGVRFELDVPPLPSIYLDKQHVLQILVNLVSNSKYALSKSENSENLLSVRCHRYGRDRLRIEVSDNGVGIAKENLDKIFRHGFTTKENGHGFGLHGSALAAREMDGSLTCRSDGPGCGATFVLELPFKPKETKQRTQRKDDRQSQSCSA